MTATIRTKYDVVVIGSGIGGLTAAAYLVRSGLSVLLIERHQKVGGYCGSFWRDGYCFDEAVHYVNHYSPGGILRDICEELEISDRLKIASADISDVILLPDIRISIYRDWRKTVGHLAEDFHNEQKGIQNFFEEVALSDFPTWYVKYRRQTFHDLLDLHFKDTRLKTALGLLATTLGLPPNQLSALAALAYFKGSVLDGGYHPVGGAQKLSDALRECFEASGGDVVVGTAVQRIEVSNGKVQGVKLEDGRRVEGRAVLSNADATYTYERLIGQEHCGNNFLNRIRKLRPSLSMVVVYLGISQPPSESVPQCSNLWSFPYYRLEDGSMDLVEDDRTDGWLHMGVSSLFDRTMAPPGRSSLTLFGGASYMTPEYWQENKPRIAQVVIERASKVLPRIKESIEVQLVATPYTLYRYTLNRQGAYRGWDPTPSQSQWGLVRQKSEIEGLYLTGHWITTPSANGGVSVVGRLGKQVAKSIIRKLKRS